LYDARLCLEGCDLCAQAAPDVIERALNGLLIHREKLTDAHFSMGFRSQGKSPCCLFPAHHFYVTRFVQIMHSVTLNLWIKSLSD
ncbi:hypothetical protein MJM04_30645, partial [Salmonella enterica subsp. enterica serovar Cerro]|nr:hypothetical protein [Salmonella enterica subsp. enterica serovar Cerro]